jgi:putative DNA primase/helicase
MADDDQGDDRGLDENEQPTLNVVPLHPDPWLAPNWLLTDEAVVRLFMQRHGDRFVFLEAIGFHEWTGHVWQFDQQRTVNRRMAELCRTICAGLKKKGDKRTAESAALVRRCSERIKDETAHPMGLFDQTPVLNMATTCVRLDRPGDWQLGPQRREDYCSKMTAVTATQTVCPTWLTFLRRITDNNQELIDYLQRVCGYCASPYTSEQSFFFCYGTGQNGKGTFLNTVKAVLGDYAAQASLELLQATTHPQHKEELASLRGTRLVLTAETAQNQSWDEAKLKQLTGGDTVRANFMRQNSFEYLPQYKIIVVGNNKPVIRNADRAMRRRLQLIPFTVEIAESEVDLGLFDKLVPEYPGILSWIMDGFVAWQHMGLMPPAAVLGATADYFENQDALQQWIDKSCLTTDVNARASSAELFNSWKLFCEATKERCGTQKAFVERMEAKGFKRWRSAKARGLDGIRLLDITERPD